VTGNAVAGNAVTPAGLCITSLSAGYGRVKVVTDFTITVNPGEVVALVGRNGAGKSTALAAAVGLRFGQASGSVTIDGTDVSHETPNAIVVAGVSLVPEGRRIFRDMTVIENLRLGAFTRRRTARREIPGDIEQVYALFPVLSRYSGKTAGELSGGQQQMVAIGQALMSRPSYLLLDEPASGVAPILVDEIYDTIDRLVGDGLGVVLVDQSVERALERSSRYSVMDNGSMVLSGDSVDSAIDRINPILLGTETFGSPPAQPTPDGSMPTPSTPRGSG
jgi:branched-chain amino acid transport system ATP-binding protein